MSAPARPGEALRVVAWANVHLHALALAITVAAIRPGTAIVPLDERMAYLGEIPLGWQLAWGSWMLCALALVAFLELLGRELPGEERRARAAVTLAVAGVAADLLGDAIQMLVLPRIAAPVFPEKELFLAFERLAGAGGMIVANGLYSLAVILLSLALKDAGKKTAALLGLLSGGSGLLLVAAGFTGEPRHAEIATAPTILFFMAWVLAASSAVSPASPASPVEEKTK